MSFSISPEVRTAEDSERPRTSLYGPRQEHVLIIGVQTQRLLPERTLLIHKSTQSREDYKICGEKAEREATRMAALEDFELKRCMAVRLRNWWIGVHE